MPGKGNTAGITGANGFIAWHLRCAMHSAGMPEARLAGRGTFESPEALRSFVEDLDVIVHLAGVNRADNDADLESANLNIAQALVSAMEETQSDTTGNLRLLNTRVERHPVRTIEATGWLLARRLG